MTDETLASLGEGAVLARIFPRLPAASAALLGPGDDAAVVAAPDGRVVVTTDTMIEGPDFRLAWSTPFQIGWKAAATNLADIAAMGAVPTALVVALAAPPETPVSFAEHLADGFREACAALAQGCGVVGGDLARSPVVTVAVTAFGDLEGRPPVLRSGARPGDVVAVAGGLGRAARGLALLFRRYATSEGTAIPVDLGALSAEESDVVRAQLQPSPPIAAGRAAALAGATAMIDVSDGLALDARWLAEASGVRVDLDGGLAPEELGGGEDHALLATFPPDAPLPAGFAAIGAVLAGKGLTVADEPYDSRGGWDPFGDSQ